MFSGSDDCGGLEAQLRSLATAHLAGERRANLDHLAAMLDREAWQRRVLPPGKLLLCRRCVLFVVLSNASDAPRLEAPDSRLGWSHSHGLRFSYDSIGSSAKACSI